MLSPTDPRWKRLSHAYGPATNIPALLERARSDLRPAHVEKTPWHDLWSALCHQGAAYSASYAAVPHLVAIAEARRGTDAQFDPIFLIASIELARLEGNGPPIEPDLQASYLSALKGAARLTDEAIVRAWPERYREVLQGSIAAFSGNVTEAWKLINPDPEENDPPARHHCDGLSRDASPSAGRAGLAT